MIPILNLTRQYNQLKDKIDSAVLDVLASGHYILGPHVKAFEEEMARYLNVKHVIGCANGTDALYLALRALKIGPGDEVITTPFTFVATSEAIIQVGATPVFVDVDPNTFNLDVTQVESAITPRTRAVLPVHLYGHPVDMAPLQELAQKYQLSLIEDCAQSIGSEYRNQKTGTFGDVGCFSFFPSKNLGAFGDGGMLTTHRDDLAERLRMLRVHGSKKRYFHEEQGVNSRLDEIQAAILRVKLPYIDQWNSDRRAAAQRYNELLRPLEQDVEVPDVKDDVLPVFHQYTIKLRSTHPDFREAVQKTLQDLGVQSMIYYPLPLYRQKMHENLQCNPSDFPVCETLSSQVLSLPMFPEITFEEQQTVVQALGQALLQSLAVSRP